MKEPDKPASAGGCQAATLLALGEAGKLHLPQAQALLVIANRIDFSSRDTGSGLSSLVKRLEEGLDALLADVEPETDSVDELKARRDLKRDAAAG